jgi:glycosyltransferase involved in cell wall biosynthesis
MAAGKPIVATSVDGAMEAIQNGKEGFLTPPRHYASLALMLLKVLKDPDLARRMGRAGRHKALREFDIRQMVRDIEKLYKEKWDASPKSKEPSGPAA